MSGSNIHFVPGEAFHESHCIPTSCMVFQAICLFCYEHGWIGHGSEIEAWIVRRLMCVGYRWDKNRTGMNSCLSSVWDEDSFV